MTVDFRLAAYGGYDDFCPSILISFGLGRPNEIKFEGQKSSRPPHGRQIWNERSNKFKFYYITQLSYEQMFRFYTASAINMLHPRNPPNQETQIPRYRFKLNQNFNLNLYGEKPRNLSFFDLTDFRDAAFSVRNLSFSIWRISGMQNFQLKVWYAHLFSRYSEYHTAESVS